MTVSMFARLAKKYQPELRNVSRRDLLKATLAASAGMLLSNCGLGGFGSSRTRNRVIVIGAGFSGLACAHELHAAGYDVTVVEAQNRIGGRVLTFNDMVPGKLVEGGGELIGTNHPAWVAYAHKFNLDLVSLPDDSNLETPYFFDGRKLTKAEEKQINDEMTAAQKPLNEAAASVNAQQPWLSPNAQELDAMSMAEWLRTANLTPLTQKAVRAQFEGNEGVALERMSYLAFLAMVKGAGLEKYWSDSENSRCAEGNHALAYKLAETLGNRIHLGIPVISVVIGSPQVMVTLADGTRLTADDVVLTVAPSVWSKIRFTPELPPALKPQMGVAVKYLAPVKCAFWKDTGTNAYGASDGDISMTWEGTAGQPGSPPSENAVLTCFSGGPAAEQARSRQGPEREEAYHKEIAQMFADYPDNAQKPSRFMDWPANPWVMAAYSFGAPRRMKELGPLLEAGIGSLHFAGEYTNWAFPGYMEGGLGSGAALAKRLALRDGVLRQAT